MSDSLADRLAARLDIQPEQTDRLIRTLAQLIHTQTARDGRVRVPGLGIFQRSEDQLTFEPDASLAEAINQKYAHLPTVSLAATQHASDTSLDEAEPATYEETAPPSVPPPLVQPEDEAEEVNTAVSWLEDEEEDTETAPADLKESADEPPPLPDETIAQEEPSFAEPPEKEPYTALKEETAFVDESTVADDATDEEDEDLIASLLADDDVFEKDDAFEEDNVLDEIDDASPSDEDVTNFDDPDQAEDAAYAALRDDAEHFEEDTFLEESEPSAWAPPGTRWTGENQDQLVPIDEVEDHEEEDTDTENLSSEETEDIIADTPFAPPGLQTQRTPSSPKPPAGETKKQDLPPRPAPRVRPTLQEENQTSQRSVWPWLLTALLFVVIAGGAYYYFNMREQPIAANDPTQAQDPVAVPSDTSNAGPAEEGPLAEDSTAATSLASGMPNAEDAAQEDTTAVAPPPPNPPTTQAGQIDRAIGGYTLVVGSRGSRETAEADAARVRQALNDDAIPVDVLQGTVNGSTRYRIGVGQEPTIDDATALKQRLGNRITADAWVTRILPDS